MVNHEAEDTIAWINPKHTESNALIKTFILKNKREKNNWFCWVEIIDSYFERCKDNFRFSNPK